MYLYVKRGIDIVISLLGIIVLSPILAITALAIKIDSPGPAIFKQKRLGRYGKEFTIYKFRSMKINSEHTGSGQYSYADDLRVTSVGKVIRKFSIDELPQFFNILNGDMSLIGFRPPLTYHPWPIEQYTDEQKEMFRLRPGVTGYAQIHGRKTVDWEERIKMSIWYTDHVSFKVDLKIFLKTIVKLLKDDDNVNTRTTV